MGCPRRTLWTVLHTPVCSYPIDAFHLSFNFLCLVLLYCIYLSEYTVCWLWDGGGGAGVAEVNQREGRGAVVYIVHKAGLKIPTWLTVSPVYKLYNIKHQKIQHLGLGVFIVISSMYYPEWHVVIQSSAFRQRWAKWWLTTFYLYLYFPHDISTTSLTFKQRVGSWG